MSYTGQFYDTIGRLYTVNILNGGSNKTLKMGEYPFKTTMDSSKDTIYQPIKYSVASIEVLTDDYMFDIYSTSLTKNKVTLTCDGVVEWVGYVLPNIYDQDWNIKKEYLTILCDNALSVIQEIPYYSDNVGARENVTFEKIIKKILRACGAYNNFYVSANFSSSVSSAPPITYMNISENVIFDDDNKQDAPDADKAMKMSNVLENICLYLGYTCIAVGSDVYFIDYDCIKNGNNTYYCFPINGSGYTTVTKAYTKQINKSDYSLSSNTISLDNVYNKAKVKDELKDFEDVIEGIWDNATNITLNTDSAQFGDSYHKPGKNTPYCLKFPHTVYNNFSGANGCVHAYFIPEMRPYPFGDSGDQWYSWDLLFVRYFLNENVYTYMNNSSYYASTNNLKYANMVLFAIYNLTQGDTEDDESRLQKCYNVYSDFYDVHGENGLLSNTDFENLTKNYYRKQVSFEKYIVLYDNEIDITLNRDHKYFNEVFNYWAAKNDGSGYGVNTTAYNTFLSNITNRTKFVGINTKNVSNVFGGDNNYFVISGDIFQHLSPYNHFLCKNPLSASEDDNVDYLDKYVWTVFCFLPCSLEYGGKWWNGTSWQDTETGFILRYWDGDDTICKKISEFTCTNISIKNTVTWNLNIDKEGYVIPVPDTRSGSVKFSIYEPYPLYSTYTGQIPGLDNWLNDLTQWIQPTFIAIKDLKIDCVIAQNGKVKTDTIYTMEIDSSYSNELDELTFKFNTYDSLKPSYSYVFNNSNGTSYVDELSHSSLSLPTALSSNGKTFSEWWYVYKIFKQYNEPSKVLNLNVRNNIKPYSLLSINNHFSGTLFIVDSIDVDYHMNRSKIKIIEKK